MKEDPCITFGSRRNMLVTDAPKEDVKEPLRSISVSESVVLYWARVYLDFRQEKKRYFCFTPTYFDERCLVMVIFQNSVGDFNLPLQLSS